MQILSTGRFRAMSGSGKENNLSIMLRVNAGKRSNRNYVSTLRFVFVLCCARRRGLRVYVVEAGVGTVLKRLVHQVDDDKCIQCSHRVAKH